MNVSFALNILSLIKPPKKFLNILSDKIDSLDFVEAVLSAECFAPYKKQILKKISNFEYSAVARYVIDIINRKELFPVQDIDTDDIEAVSYSVPIDLVGYYGNYDANISIDDLTGMSTPEFVATILLNYSSFVDFIGAESIHEEIDNIADETIKTRVLDFIQNYELKDLYRCFLDDVAGGRYSNNPFMQDLTYLFNRLCQNTGCPFIDCIPDMMQENVFWDNVDSLVEMWAEQKKKEKRWIKFVRKLRANSKFQKKFYKVLFEIVNRYKTSKL